MLSVNRPRREGTVALGGPSIAVAPDGEVIACGTEPLVMVELDPARVTAARKRYPGYLAVPAGLYAEGWRSVGGR